MSRNIKYFGYRHTNGSLHLKRFFTETDFDEVCTSSFTARVYGPFFADSWSQANDKLSEIAAKEDRIIADLQKKEDDGCTQLAN